MVTRRQWELAMQRCEVETSLLGTLCSRTRTEKDDFDSEPYLEAPAASARMLERVIH